MVSLVCFIVHEAIDPYHSHENKTKRDDWPAIPGRYLTSDYVYKTSNFKFKRGRELTITL